MTAVYRHDHLGCRSVVAVYVGEQLGLRDGSSANWRVRLGPSEPLVRPATGTPVITHCPDCCRRISPNPNYADIWPLAT